MRIKRNCFIILCVYTIVAMLSGCHTDKNGQARKIRESAPAYVPRYEGAAQESAYVAAHFGNWWDKGLPAINDRLPAEPLVLECAGALGGVLNLPVRSAVQNVSFDKRNGSYLYTYAEPSLILSEPVILWDEEKQSFLPNIFTKWDITEDNKTYSFTIREGIRWSDGTPVTSRDVQFALEDVWAFLPTQGLAKGESDVIPLHSIVWHAQGKKSGELPVFQSLNNYQFTVTYTKPDPGLLKRMAMAKNGYEDILIPFDFYKLFHALYSNGAQSACDAMIRFGVYPKPEDDTPSNEIPSWRCNFGKMLQQRQMQFYYNNMKYQPTIPSLSAWVQGTPGQVRETDFHMLREGTMKGFANIKYVRNPYYWKIDKEMNQLPYLDELAYYISGYGGVTKMYTNTDFNSTIEIINQREANTPYWLNLVNTASEPMFASALYPYTFSEITEDKVPTRSYIDNITNGVGLGLSFCYDAANEKQKAAIQDTRFRKALSMALDRQQLLTRLGCDGVPAALASEYDPQGAIALLAECGYNINIPLQPVIQLILPGLHQDIVLEWLAESWKAIGLDVTLTGTGMTYEKDAITLVQLALVPEVIHEFPLADIYLADDWELWLTNNSANEVPEEIQQVLSARDAWRNQGGSYQDYTKAIQETQCYIPLLENIVTPASVSEDLHGVIGDTLPKIWRHTEQWYKAKTE